MFNPPKIGEWQWMDESVGLIFPWLTLPALEVIQSWDLTDKNVFEYGGGHSTKWWAAKALHVTTIERNKEYVTWIMEDLHRLNLPGVRMIESDACEGIESGRDWYVNAVDLLPMLRYNIVVVDDIFRYECIVKALTLPRPVILIVDNWQQDFVFICQAAEDLMKEYDGHFYTQPDHTNHEGRPWTTAIFYLK